MIVNAAYSSSAGMGNWLTDLADSAKKNLHIEATFPTPLGPLKLNPLDQAATSNQARSLASGIAKSIRNARVDVRTNASATDAPAPASPFDSLSQYVHDKVPGGWLTVGGVSLGVLWLLKRAIGGRK